VKKENRKVRLENGDIVTFTQRGKNANSGFIRIQGQTISGYTLGNEADVDINGNPYFYANGDSPNAYLTW
jgi:hypothetical protein